MKIVRLKGKKRFDEIFAAGIRYRRQAASCVVLYKDKPDRESVSVAVAVSKKNCRRAVKRNRLKRLMREAVRQLSAEYPELLAELDAVVLYWNKEPESASLIGLAEVKAQVGRLLQKVYAEKAAHVKD